ncbi:DUF6339 family protein [Variovorax sp. LG9.2]|uniref:DUF6339 family protein n=1 Tax=Variovorax sp. LG9.2 TaxID=3048626 RepID=UPI002B232EC6|nr:DUF6339 family protein [Variovorax sp. LG9.2]MEB0056715.1 DUF6339 family protein [Variovorax sp. LG9.2]
MRYPIITAVDATRYLLAKREGTEPELDSIVQHRGSGTELDQWFIKPLREHLERQCAKLPNGLSSKTDPAANTFEARASRIVHAAIPNSTEMLIDPDFWVWLAVVHFPEVVEWRYRYQNRKSDTFAQLDNYGIGSRSDNLIYRLWLRAELVLDADAKDRYHLADAGQIDFYRSHLFRQGYANARNFSRALLRYQYPNKDLTEPRLKTLEIRELVKRLRRMKSNLFLEILAEDDCRYVIETEAAVVLAAE